jgi:hypothetical protein
MRNTLLFLTVSLLLAAGSAQAGTLWDFNFTDTTGNTFDGHLIATDSVAGQYLVTGINATYGGYAVSLLAPGSPLGNDNLLNGSDPWFTFSGLAFEVPGLSNMYSIWVESGLTQLFIAPIGADLSDPNVGYYADFQSFNLSEAPEPSALALLAGGLALIGWRTRRRA